MSNQPFDPNLILVSEIELSYKSRIKASDRIKIKNAKEVYDVFLRSWAKDKIGLIEQFKVLLLNNGKRVLGIVEISSGGITSTIVDVRLIFIAALKAGAVSFIVCHNHPSGNLVPSRNDEEITARLKAAGKILNIDLADHLIITLESYYSFAEEGIL